MDSLHQTVNRIAGNVDWVESLDVVACGFPGFNSSGTRRRATSAWLAVVTKFPKITPPADVLKLLT